MVRSPKTVARIAGVFYLLMFAFSIFATSVRSSIVVANDAAATANNIRASATLFRVGIVSDLLQITCFLLAYLALYMLFKDVDRLAAAAMVIFTAISVAIYSLNLLNLFTAATVATGSDYPRALGTGGAASLTMLYVTMQANGYFFAEMFFALLLLPLGYLAIKADYFPSVLGVLLIIGGVGYFADLFARALAPGYGTGVTLLAIPGAIAELSLMLWLLVRGVSAPRTEAQRATGARRMQATS